MPTETQDPPRPRAFGNILGDAIKPFEAEIAAKTAPTAPPAKPAPETPVDTPPVKPVTEIKPAAAAKPEAKPADVAPDPDEEITQGRRSPKAADWERVKKSRDEERKLKEEFKSKAEKAAEYEKELTELRKAPKHNAELIKKIESERDEFKSKYEAFIVQFTPEFQAKFDGQISQVVDSLKTIVPAAEAAKLAELLNLPDCEAKRKAIAEITDGMDQFQIGEIVAANREIRRINGDRQAAVAKAKETLSGIASERQKASEESRTKLSKLMDETLGRFSTGETAIPVFQKKDGDEAWNSTVAERESVARKILTGDLTPEDRAEAAIWAAAAPGILAKYKADVAAKDAELAELKATVEKLQGANPGITTSQPGKGGGEKQIRGSFRRAMSESVGGS